MLLRMEDIKNQLFNINNIRKITTEKRYRYELIILLDSSDNPYTFYYKDKRTMKHIISQIVDYYNSEDEDSHDFSNAGIPLDTFLGG